MGKVALNPTNLSNAFDLPYQMQSPRIRSFIDRMCTSLREHGVHMIDRGGDEDEDEVYPKFLGENRSLASGLPSSSHHRMLMKHDAPPGIPSPSYEHVFWLPGGATLPHYGETSSYAGQWYFITKDDRLSEGHSSDKAASHALQQQKSEVMVESRLITKYHLFAERHSIPIPDLEWMNPSDEPDEVLNDEVLNDE